MKSFERRIFEAYVAKRGMRLTPDDVDHLLIIDDAIATRVSNCAATDAGADEPGCDCLASIGNKRMTWRQFGEFCDSEK